jgi:hypothetical protein
MLASVYAVAIAAVYYTRIRKKTVNYQASATKDGTRQLAADHTMIN